MRSRYFRLLLLLPVIVLIVTGCSEYSDVSRGFYAGETITPDQLAAISAGLAVSDTAASENNGLTTEKETKPPDTDANGNIIVYWTKSGSVWHVDRGCGSLANSTTIESGTIKDAEDAKKDRACLKCGQGYSESATSEPFGTQAAP